MEGLVFGLVAGVGGLFGLGDPRRFMGERAGIFVLARQSGQLIGQGVCVMSEWSVRSLLAVRAQDLLHKLVGGGALGWLGID